MGITNFQSSFNHKFSLLSGELADKRAQVARITSALPGLQARVDQLEATLDHGEAFMSAVTPGWSRESITPKKPFVHKIPVRIGEASRRALDVLRMAAAPMTARDIARELIARDGIEADQRMEHQITNTIGQSLRKKRGKIVDATDSWPQQWFIIQPTNIIR